MKQCHQNINELLIKILKRRAIQNSRICEIGHILTNRILKFEGSTHKKKCRLITSKLFTHTSVQSHVLIYYLQNFQCIIMRLSGVHMNWRILFEFSWSKSIDSLERIRSLQIRRRNGPKLKSPIIDILETKSGLNKHAVHRCRFSKAGLKVCFYRKFY